MGLHPAFSEDQQYQASAPGLITSGSLQAGSPKEEAPSHAPFPGHSLGEGWGGGVEGSGNQLALNIYILFHDAPLAM